MRKVRGVHAQRITFQGLGVRIVGDRWEPRTGQVPVGTVLLLHGGGQTRHSWRKSARRLAEQGWTAIAVDARGHGDSDWSPDGDYSMDALVADLRAIVSSLPTRPVLVGASMGGMTSLVAEGEHSGLSRALVLVDIAPRTEPAGVKRILDFMSAAPDGFSTLSEVAEAVHAYNPHRERPTNFEGLKKNVRQRTNGRWYWHWDPAFLKIRNEVQRAASDKRLHKAARRIEVPTLLVRGSNSDVVSPEGAEELRTLIPTAEIEEVVAGHMVAGDDNDVFASQMLGFLKRALRP